MTEASAVRSIKKTLMHQKVICSELILSLSNEPDEETDFKEFEFIESREEFD